MQVLVYKGGPIYTVIPSLHIKISQNTLLQKTCTITLTSPSKVQQHTKPNKPKQTQKDETMASAAEIRQKLIGAWALVEYKTEPVNGGPASYPLGQDAAGIIMYTPDGYMSAQLMQRGAPKFAVPDIGGGNEHELAEAMRRYMAYSGRFALEDKAGTPRLTHQMEVSSFPNWLGNVQERTVALDGDYLTLGTDGPILVQVGAVILVILSPPLFCFSVGGDKIPEFSSRRSPLSFPSMLDEAVHIVC